MKTRSSLFLLFLFLISCGTDAFAGTPAPAPDEAMASIRGSAYQNDLIDQTLNSHHYQVDPKPEGKRIEKIVVAPYDVILRQDLWPEFFNVFHSTTKSDVIERELLFNVGDRWNTLNVLESARNIRNYLLVAVGQIVPVQGSNRDSVIALVVTKDLWSLRTNFNFSYVGSSLQQLSLQLTEENIAGRMKQVSALFGMDLDTRQLGEQAADPRIWGSRVAINEQAAIITNRATNLTEGGFGSVNLGQPLYSLSTEWAWNVSTAIRKDIHRQYFADGIEEIESPVVIGDTIPYAYDEHLVDISATVTRSFGQMNKTDLIFGWAAAMHDFGLPNYASPDFAPAPQPASQNYFLTNVVPYSERASMLTFGVHQYTGNFVETIDVNTFALTELFRTGPDIALQFNFANRAFGLDSNYLETHLSAGENWIWNDDIFSAVLIGNIRYETGLQPDLTSVAIDQTDWVNRLFSIDLKNVSPRIWRGTFPFRVVVGAQYVRRSEDLNHSVSTIGGDTNLRGYPSQYLAGPQLVSGNLELRTDPLAFKSVHFGEAVFFDTGDAFESPQSVQFLSSVGFGERVLFPQFNKAVLRLDVAFPLNTVIGASPAYFSAQFGQAF
jgi:Omp85 superfamily domain